VETIGSKRSYALIWCMPNNDDDDDDTVWHIFAKGLFMWQWDELNPYHKLHKMHKLGCDTTQNTRNQWVAKLGGVKNYIDQLVNR